MTFLKIPPSGRANIQSIGPYLVLQSLDNDRYIVRKDAIIAASQYFVEEVEMGCNVILPTAMLGTVHKLADLLEALTKGGDDE